MKKYLLVLPILSLTMLLFIGACDGSGSDISGFDPSSTDDDPFLENPDIATELQVKFSIVSEQGDTFDTLTYQVLPTFDADSQCEISTSESSNQDLSCVMDVNEQDLYYHGFRIEYVIPTGMCDYFNFRNHWHYDQEVGTGPIAVWLRKYVDDDGGASGSPECFVMNSDGVWYPTDPSVDAHPGDGATIGNGDDCESLGVDAGLELRNINPQNGNPTCIYDRTADFGTNCCHGNYDRYIQTIDNQDTADDGLSMGTDLTTDLSYGSEKNMGKCLQGAAILDGNWTKNDYGIPRGKIYFTRERGIAERYQLPGLSQKHNKGQNQIYANWYAGVEGVDTRHSHSGPVNGGSSTRPIFHAPLEDRSGDYQISSGQTPYEFRCLNENNEVLHRIRFYIREYNSREQFDDFVDSLINGTQDADRNGVEGGGGADDCEGFLTDQNCNDRSDADDFNPDTPGDTPPYDCSSSEGSGFSTTGTTGCFPMSSDQ